MLHTKASQHTRCHTPQGNNNMVHCTTCCITQIFPSNLQNCAIYPQKGSHSGVPSLQESAPITVYQMLHHIPHALKQLLAGSQTETSPGQKKKSSCSGLGLGCQSMVCVSFGCNP